jgi:two-component system sensor histidine kinase BaeS
MKTLLAKLMIALLATALLSLVTVIIITRINLRNGFVEFLERQESRQLNNLVPVLAEIYQQNDGWTSLIANEQNWYRLFDFSRSRGAGSDTRLRRPGRPPDRARAPPNGDGSFGRPPGPRPAGRANGSRRAPDRLQIRDRLFLLDKDRDRIAGAFETETAAELLPIPVGGETVGWIGLEPMGEMLTPEAGIFLSEQRRSGWLSLLVAGMLAAVLAFLLARHFSRPISHLADTVRQLKKGDYASRVEVDSADEIGLLAEDVNSLAATLEASEQTRRRWMAEIAHELRTPIAILKGELEALRDGVRVHDATSLGSLGEEVDHLAGLVDDLQMLALSDTGALRFNLQSVDLSSLVCSELEVFRPRFEDADMSIEQRVEQGAVITGDLMRLRQLLRNLLENSLRYTNSAGQIELGLTINGGMIALWLDDSAPGVEPEHLSRLFERFYRVEESRNRAAGGSGLGLAICSNIVAGHGGTISAQHSRLGGVSIRISLPIASSEARTLI